MEKRRTDALQRLLSIAIIILCWQFSAAMVLALVPQSSNEVRSPDKLTYSNCSAKDVSCKEALKNAPEIKVGMRESEALGLLGEPTERLKNEWVYNFMACVQPPHAGEQRIIGLDLIFSEGTIKQIKYAAVDATGPGPVYSPGKKREKKRTLKSRKHATANAMLNKSFEPSGSRS